MALIRNNYDGGATSRRRRDERGRYMMEEGWHAPRSEHTNYIEYDEYPTGARQMGFGEAYADPYSERNMRGGYVRYSRADMNDNDVRRMNSGGKHGEFSEQGEHKRHYGGMQRMEDYRQSGMQLDRKKAEEWVRGMKGEASEGETWSMKEIEEIAKKNGMPTQEKKLVELYAVMNMLASDYYKVAEEFDVLEDDFFLCMAKAFINDEDAVPNKVAMYYECIAKK